MPKPVAPYEWQFAARSGTLTTFLRAPSDYRIIPPPTIKRGDGGQVRDGLEKLWLQWETLTPAQWDQLVGFWNAAINAAGLAKVRYWDEMASSGAGAWSSVNCTIGEYFTARRGGRPSSPNYHTVEWTIEDLGIAS